MLADEVAVYLAGAGLGLVLGSSSAGLFSAPFPTEAGDAATCVIEYTGLASVRAMGPSNGAPIFEQPKFQVVTRDRKDNAFGVRSLQKSIYSALMHLVATLPGTTGGLTSYAYVDALQSPFFLKDDDEGRTYFACNYRAVKVLS